MSDPDETIYAKLLSSRTPETLARTAVISPAGTFTYGALKGLVDSLARALASEGIAAGERVMIVLPNSVQYIVAFLAVTARGGVVVPVDAQAGPERLRFMLADTEARLCLHLPGSPPAGVPSGVSRALDLDPAVPDVRLSASRDDLPLAGRAPLPPHGRDSSSSPPPPQGDIDSDAHGRARRAGERGKPSHHHSDVPMNDSTGRERVSEDQQIPLTSAAPVGGESVAAIVYTAGSTGRPKGVVLRHRNFLAIARTLSSVIAMDDSHRDLIISPMTHSGGWQRVTSTLMTGGCVVIPEAPLSVPAILQQVEVHNVTGFFAAPPILRTILMSSPEKVARALGGLRSIETASAPLAPSEVEQLLSLLPRTNLFVQYGLTECSRAVILDARGRPDKRGTVGKATRGVSLAIADEHGRNLGPGQEGEILLSAEQCAEGYWRQPATDAERFRGAWLHTGDFGSLDEEGFLTFLGRRDDMINCGGHSYFPKEVEAELGAPRAVKDYLIAGVPDPQKILGQIPWAFVVPTPESDFSPQEFLASARQRLPAHMVPRRVVVIPSLPLTTTGKPSRRLAVERYGPDAAPPHEE